MSIPPAKNLLLLWYKVLVHKYFLIALLVVVLASLAYSLYPRECYPARVPWSIMGSQGYRVFSGETLKSFEHHNRRICVPDGWVALGTKEVGEGWATFAEGYTGVLIKNDAFLSEEITDARGGFSTRLIYPAVTDAGDVMRYKGEVRRVFERIDTLYDGNDAEHNHTVLITAGISDDAFVYPDPHHGVSIYVRPAGDPRGRELFIHAIMHLYNRHRAIGREYLTAQMPFSPEEFEELEATWAELAFAESSEARLGRTLYLYRVHTALMTKNFGLVTEHPFSDKDAFARVVPQVTVPPESSFLDYQYGHYVLAPLVMVAIDGLLAEAGYDTRVEEILVDIHGKPGQNFLSRVESLVGAQNRTQIDEWVAGHGIIPWPLIERGLKRYILSP